MQEESSFFKAIVPILTIIFSVIFIFKEIFQMVNESLDYLNFENLADSTVCILVTICQFYYWRTGKRVNGYYITEQKSNFEYFLLPMIVLLHLSLIG